MFRYILLAIIIIAIDQITKLLVINNLDFAEVINILPGFNLTLAYNYGAAFGILDNAGGWQRWLFLIFAVIISIIILIWMKYSVRKKMILESFALSLILGGAIGNFIDRVWYGYVIDFIDIYIKNWHWYTFNLADSAITVGAVIIMIDIIFSASNHKNT